MESAFNTLLHIFNCASPLNMLFQQQLCEIRIPHFILLQWTAKKLKDSPKVTKLVDKRTRLQTQALEFKHLHFTSSMSHTATPSSPRWSPRHNVPVWQALPAIPFPPSKSHEHASHLSHSFKRYNSPDTEDQNGSEGLCSPARASSSFHHTILSPYGR